MTMRLYGYFDAATWHGADSLNQYDGIIDLKTAGERVITPGLVEGEEAGDTLAVLPVGTWIDQGGYTIPYAPADISSEDPGVWPIVDILYETELPLLSLKNLDFHGSALYTTQ
jgi:hypothetical protein